jgi:membrane-associated phospholipid phosphatase
MIEWIQNIDNKWLLAINNDLKSTFFDVLCPFMRTKSYWYPLYALMIILGIKHFGKNVWWLVAIGFLLVLVSDQLSANFIKNTVQRLRPCNNPDIKTMLHTIVGCGPINSYSFVSAHATNHFAIAVFLSLSFKQYYPWLIYAGIFWASLIGFSQIYVGVHYPSDVICGSAIGASLGYIAAKSIHMKLISKTA